MKAMTVEEFFHKFVRVMDKRLHHLTRRYSTLRERGPDGFPEDVQPLLRDSVNLAQPGMAPTGSCTYEVIIHGQVHTFCIDNVTEAECTDLGSKNWTQGGTCAVETNWR
jgi:hypothetical protein